MATNNDGDQNRKLFAGIQFYVEESKNLNEKEAESLINLLEENGALQYPQSAAQSEILMKKITHIISATSDFPNYEPAIDALKTVVKPEWVKVSLLKRKLANPRPYSPDPRLFFTGVVVCCADLPTGDEDAIYGGVLAMGGLHSKSVSKMVTHIVALTLDSEKCKIALAKNLNCKIVLPHWFDNCLKLGSRIDESPYTMPDPEILRERPGGRIPAGDSKNLRGATSAKPGRLPIPSTSPNSQTRQLTVFQQKKVMLSNDLEIGSHLREAIEDIIRRSGSSVTGDIRKANIFVCQYRESLEYRIASRAGSDVGNLPWLYHLITHDSWTSPLRRLLHYPISRQGLPGFKDFRISLSNYNGEARVYLENLAKAAGGEFTKTMKEDNTHLITAHLASEKCDAAKEWNINLVNHLWLEESYAKWKIQTLTTTRYVTFPDRTNLSEIVGQTPIDKQAIERCFFPIGSDSDPNFESGKFENITPSKLDPEDPGSTTRPSNYVVDDRTVPFQPLQSDQHTPNPSKANRQLPETTDFKTPVRSRLGAKAIDIETPSTTGSRSAKEKAVAQLQKLAPDIALFEKESKRRGGVVFGGRKSSADMCMNGNRKRSMTNEDSGSDAGEDTRGAKKAKKSKEAASMRLMLSGYAPWVGMAKKEGEERVRLRELGVLITQDPAKCTHLAAPHIVRTQKFLCALAHAPIVISTDFVDQCLAENKKLQPESFELKDPEGEKRLGIKLADATARAKQNKGRLLQGYSIYCTENVHGGYDTYKSIVEANGGKCLQYRARAATSASVRTGAAGDDAEAMDTEIPKYIYLMSGVTHEEARLWPKFRKLAQTLERVPRIVKTDWMIDLGLSQQIQWHESYELTDKDAQADE